MTHIHIDKAVGGTNDGCVTPYIDRQPVFRMIKKREPDPVRFHFDPDEPIQRDAGYETEDYKLSVWHAGDTDITFWVEYSMAPEAALCHLLLRYVPKEDLVEVRT